MRSIKGFTIIELLVAVSIIAVLASLGIATYSNTTGSGEDARRKGDIDAIASAYELSYNAKTRTYSALTEADFSTKALPVPPEGGSYIGMIPSGTTATAFAVCAVLSNGIATDCDSLVSSDKCYCKSSINGILASSTPAPTVAATSTPGPIVASGITYPRVTSDAGGGSVGWQFLDGAKANGGEASLAYNIYGASTNFLHAVDFGFNIPQTATILGITVESSVGAPQYTVAPCARFHLQLIKSGTRVGSIKTTNMTNLNYQSYSSGGASDLWGTTLTPTEINSSNFGVSLQGQEYCTGGQLYYMGVDYLRIIVHYR